jgi:hypothetical protein
MGSPIQQPEPPVGMPPELGEEQQATPSTGSEMTPLEFYAEFTKREDVREILRQLASASSNRKQA